MIAACSGDPPAMAQTSPLRNSCLTSAISSSKRYSSKVKHWRAGKPITHSLSRRRQSGSAVDHGVDDDEPGERDPLEQHRADVLAKLADDDQRDQRIGDVDAVEPGPRTHRADDPDVAAVAVLERSIVEPTRSCAACCAGASGSAWCG